ncbi:MAG: NADH-quinone oxidoreductase subunit C [Bacteroidetes bacterium]|nr:MAG: NADH-quinone oxidoreductase subunit C [Bacteroidota bacterium]
MAVLTSQIVIDDLVGKFGEAISEVYEPYGLMTFTTTREQIVPVLEYLYFHNQFRFQFLTDLCGVHFPDNAGKELCVTYHVHSLVHNVRVRIKVYLPIENPTVPTASKIFASANWQERETYDFYGIIFEGHPRLARILNVDDMDYFPLRKEYPLEDQTRRDKEDLFFGR